MTDGYKPFDDGDEDEGTDQESLDRTAADDERKRLVLNEEIKHIRIYKAFHARGQLSLESLRIFMKLIDDGYNLWMPASMHDDLYGRSMLIEKDRIEYIESASCEQLQLLLIDYILCNIKMPNSSLQYDNYIARNDGSFEQLKSIAKHESIDIAIAEQEPAPKKPGRKSNAEKAALAAQEAASKPAPVEKWPSPTPKKESAES